MATAPEAAASSEPSIPKPRRWKRTKGGDQAFMNESTTPISYGDLVDKHDSSTNLSSKRSYRDTIIGLQATTSTQSKEATDFMEDSGNFSPEMFNNRITVEYKKVGKHDCPCFKLSKWEEERIAKPWRKGLIVKLLGRKIGYKALESRLNQFWAKDGTLTIIDLGQDFFLVMFTCDTDRDLALTRGPWLIYDHYLTVRQWYPNFQPERVTLDKVVVWVRFSGLPIEMYDPSFLHFIGNIIGKTVKVDRTTMQHTRGKYARLCVEMDISKPLPAVFEAHDKLYKIEYEGLHLLCINCGKFGHMKEACQVVADPVNTVSNGEPCDSDNQNIQQQQQAPDNSDGLWTVVQKGRHVMKKKPQYSKADTTRSAPRRNGSRFQVLNYDTEINGNKETPTTTQENPISPPQVTASNPIATRQENNNSKGPTEVTNNTPHTSNMEEDIGNLNEIV